MNKIRVADRAMSLKITFAVFVYVAFKKALLEYPVNKPEPQYQQMEDVSKIYFYRDWRKTTQATIPQSRQLR